MLLTENKSMKLITLLVVMVAYQAIGAQSITTNFPKKIETPAKLPKKKNVWVFVLAGQSNMAGRGFVEPQDTISNERILTINKDDAVALAKEPLHYYEPARTGLDCGMAFARTLIQSVPKNVSLLIVPIAVGGSSIQQWLGDSTWHDVKLLTNAKHKIGVAKRFGVYKGILWHQGESNANQRDVKQHASRLTALADTLRRITGVRDLPFLVGELGAFSKNPELFSEINLQLQSFIKTDRYSAIIKTGDLPHKGDNLHFDGPAQRKMGERFAEAYVAGFLRR
jgi:hypothetical protein